VTQMKWFRAWLQLISVSSYSSPQFIYYHSLPGRYMIISCYVQLECSK